MGDSAAALMQLRPVTFRYKKPSNDGSRPIQYGLIAEEVAEVMPDLAVFNAQGQPETVKYHLLPSLLLPAFQQQQRTIAAQAAEIALQNKTAGQMAEEMAELKKLVRLQAEQMAREQKSNQSLAEQMAAVQALLANLGAPVVRARHAAEAGRQ